MVLLRTLAGCGNDLSGAGGECDPTSTEPQCEDGFVCEAVVGGENPNACHIPIILRGQVFDAETRAVLPGAHVLALNEERFAVTDVAITDAMGNYELSAPARRNADGSPHLGAVLTLRADAADYQSFPSGVRTSLPINAADAVLEEDARYVIDLPLTDVALIALPADQRGAASVSGQVAEDGRGGGILVVAEGPKVVSTVSDRNGLFTIFNVSPGSYEIRGYAAGIQIEPAVVEVADEAVVDVQLPESDKPLATLSGSLQVVNAPGGSKTTVVLVVASTMQQAFVRGDVPPGLRAPRSGDPAITGSWMIEGVPEGDYFVLAAFENDSLVRDPDPNIAGTQIVGISVPDAAQGANIVVPDSFKITEALQVLGPGTDVPEAVSLTPTFRWADDSSEDLYQLVVYDAFGEEVWRVDDVPEVNGSGDVTVTYAGPALEVGMYYQFRATSVRLAGSNKPNVDRPPGPISTTEDLRGVFFVQP